MNYIEQTDTRFKDDDKIFFFEWTEGGGTVTFGYHGTEEEWAAYQLLHLKGRTINLVQKRFICTGKEQKEYVRRNLTKA